MSLSLSSRPLPLYFRCHYHFLRGNIQIFWVSLSLSCIFRCHSRFLWGHFHYILGVTFTFMDILGVTLPFFDILGIPFTFLVIQVQLSLSHSWIFWCHFLRGYLHYILFTLCCQPQFWCFCKYAFTLKFFWTIFNQNFLSNFFSFQLNILGQKLSVFSVQRLFWLSIATFILNRLILTNLMFCLTRLIWNHIHLKWKC